MHHRRGPRAEAPGIIPDGLRLADPGLLSRRQDHAERLPQGPAALW
jgi:hypothetical protein